MDWPRVYSQQGELLAILDSAMGVSWKIRHNDLSEAELTLPAADPNNEHMQAHNLVQIADGDEAKIFRVLMEPKGEGQKIGGERAYKLEHAAATLVDDLLFGYHEIGGTGIFTEDVIRYILDRQTVRRWQLGRCDYHDQFAYKFENADLLSALFAVGKVLSGYKWDFDTRTSPWTVNLLRLGDTPECEIRYRRNMQEIERSMDASGLVTRLYPLGYGEGVNQLTIKPVNGGCPYLEADTAARWGIKQAVYPDRTIEDAKTLKAVGETVLDTLKNPRMSYKASAVDLYKLTGDDWDRFDAGRLVHVIDEDEGIDFGARIVEVEKRDILGDPGEIELTIANHKEDLSDMVGKLAMRQGIHDLWAQGATNLYAQSFLDNADPEHPAVMRLYVPKGCVRINQMLLSWQLSPFRAYETGAAAGGETICTTTSGGGSTVTSSAGGESERTSAAGGNYVQTLPIQTTTTAAYTEGTIVGEGDMSGRTGAALSGDGTVRTKTDDYTGRTASGGSTQLSTSGSSRVRTDSSGSHSHGTNAHDHGINGARTTKSAPSTTTAGSHSHDITHTHTANISHSHGMTHSHGMAHVHSMQHRHRVTCTVTIPAQVVNVPAHSHTFRTSSHTHSVSVPAHSHNVNLRKHSHEIQYGIYEGATARSIRLNVDGQEVPGISGTEMDIIQWLKKDEAGRITRGAWHEIRLIPDKLTRIEANMFVQAFVQSRGGGDL